MQPHNVRNPHAHDTRLSGRIGLEMTIRIQRAQKLKSVVSREQENDSLQSAKTAGKPAGCSASDRLNDAPRQRLLTKLTCRTNEDANGLLPARWSVSIQGDWTPAERRFGLRGRCRDVAAGK